VTRSVEFNTILLGSLVSLLFGTSAFADEVRKWRDAEGNLHYSVTGSPQAPSDAKDHPILEGRDSTPEESFSVGASLRRREIERKLTQAGRDLDEIRARIQETEKKTFDVWVPAVTRDSRSAQASLDAQRDAFLAASQFQQEKADALRHLRRRERDQLKDAAALWKDFGALGDEVTQHYGTPPGWWRNRLDCGRCPTAAEVEQALHKPRETPTPNDGKKPAKRKNSDDDEDWEDAWD
jgi:hypothetical protein